MAIKLPYWFLDGFVGTLGLVIYNFLLYLIEVVKITGFVGEIENTMGYFVLNTFTDFGFTRLGMIFGVITVFLIAFGIGIVIGKIVRRQKKYQ